MFFQNLINSIRQEGSLQFTEETVHPLVKTIIEGELEWDLYLFGDNTLGFDPHSIDVYVKYLANLRLRRIGLKPLYLDDKYKVNPFEHLESNIFNSEGAEKTNFFEGTVIEYNQSSQYSEEEWDDI